MRPIAFALTVLLLTPSLALADDVSAARKHFERGTALYDLQRYSDAAAEYEAAFDARNDPAFLFNIGQAYRFAKEYEKSIRSFKAFLRRVPQAPMRSQIEGWVAEMQASLETQARNDTHPAQPPTPAVTQPPPATTPTTEPTTPAATTSEQPRHGRALTIAGFTAAGVGLAALGTGIGFAVAARGPYDELNSPKPGYVFDQSTQDALHRDQAIEISMITVGSVLVVGGVVVGVIGLRQHRSEHAQAASPALAEVR